MTKDNLLAALPALLLVATAVSAAPIPVSPPANTTGIPADAMRRFANAFTFYDPAGRAEQNNTPQNAVGPADGATVSLGDLTSSELAEGRSPGVITLAFDDIVFDGPGADLAVFENASTFGGFFPDPFTFAELAFVEVSTNGFDFARFPSVSLNIEPDDGIDEPNELLAPFGRDFAALNTTFVSGLAGVHDAGIGTPFDLADLAGDALVQSGAVELDNIRFVRIVDIPGTGDITDSLGNPILDTSVTQLTGGFDLDAVGALNVTPEPSALLLVVLGAALVAAPRR